MTLSEKLVDRALTRRQFLAKLGAAALGAAIAIIGALSAEASVIYCCNLCRSDNGQRYPNCACSWCWTCCHRATQSIWQCCECHTSTAPCNGSCGNVSCSWIEYVGPC